MRLGEIKTGLELGKRQSYKYIWASCEICNRETWLRLYHGQPRNTRCHKCAMKVVNGGRVGPISPSWAGGRHKTAEGYIKVWVDPTDFFRAMADNHGYVPEHRLVLAHHLRRCLVPWETVHHKNAVKDDNRLENLELLPSSHKHSALTRMQNYIKRLETQVSELKFQVQEQATQIKVLRWRINEVGQKAQVGG